MTLRGTPGHLARFLDSLPLSEFLETSLEVQAEHVLQAVHATLDTSPGGDHEQPWRRTGALQASFSISVEGLTAKIGSNDIAATAQENGTRTDPPRPFLLSAVNTVTDSIVSDLGRGLYQLIAGQQG